MSLEGGVWLLSKQLCFVSFAPGPGSCHQLWVRRQALAATCCVSLPKSLICLNGRRLCVLFLKVASYANCLWYVCDVLFSPEYKWWPECITGHSRWIIQRVQLPAEGGVLWKQQHQVWVSGKHICSLQSVSFYPMVLPVLKLWKISLAPGFSIGGSLIFEMVEHVSEVYPSKFKMQTTAIL